MVTAERPRDEVLILTNGSYTVRTDDGQEVTNAPLLAEAAR
jgi:hypothetical protein